MVRNMFKVNNQDTGMTALASFWCVYCYCWTYLTTCSIVFIAKFEDVITGWIREKKPDSEQMRRFAQFGTINTI